MKSNVKYVGHPEGNQDSKKGKRGEKHLTQLESVKKHEAWKEGIW